MVLMTGENNRSRRRERENSVWSDVSIIPNAIALK
jgi:hypothetical protein